MIRSRWKRSTAGPQSSCPPSDTQVEVLGDSPIAGIDDLQRHLTMSQVAVRRTEQLRLDVVPAHKSRG